jgi:hypothetical protein
MTATTAFAGPVTGPLPVEVGGKYASGQIQHATLVSQPLTWLGKTLHRLKGINAATQQPVAWVWDEKLGLQADLGKGLLAAERKARDADMGALSDTLWAAYIKQAVNEPYPVLVWLPTYEPYDDKVARQAQRAQAIAKLWAKAPWLQAIAKPVDYAPALLAHLTIDQVGQLAHLPEVAQLLPFKVGKPAGSVTYVDTLQAAYGTTGYSGNGVNVCMIEANWPHANYTAINSIAGKNCPNGPQDAHARCSAAVIRSTASPYGTAKDSTQYWGNWSVGQCSSEEGGISYCAGLTTYVWNVGYFIDGGANKLLDYHVRINHYPLVVVPTGDDLNDTTACPNACTNAPGNSVAWGGNLLVVGGSRECDDSDRSNDLALCGTYSLNHSSIRDREQPQLVAPAQDIDADNFSCGAGTSWASAMVAGIGTQLVEKNSNLITFPEAMRAILICSANENVHGGVLDLDDGTDDRDGAGEANAAKALRLGDNANKVNGGNSAVALGFDYGSMNSTDTPAGNWYSEVYNAKSNESNKRIRVVLTWAASATCSDATDKTTCTDNWLDADLDLYVYRNGQLIDGSYSYDNSFEFVEFDAVADATYEIKIRVYSWTALSTKFGLAWEIGNFSTN